MNNKKSIGILTFHRPLNYGASLQAIATYEYLKKQNYDVEIIDYRQKRIENSRKIIGRRWNVEKSYFKKIKSISHDIIYLPIELKRIYYFNRFIKINSKTGKKCKNENELFCNSMNKDILLVGSDLVWNWDLDSQLNSVFFLEYAKKINARKISYASSIGTSKIPNECIRNLYKRYLENFNYISVREKTAQDLLQPLTDKTIYNVLDPTLLLDPQDWVKMETKMSVSSKYIVFYILEFTEEVKQIIKYIENKFKYKIIFFTLESHYNNKAKNMYKYGPAEFLYLIHNAELVITNSFHGMIFSMMFQKEFYTIPHSSRGSRMIDLAKIFNMDNRIIYNIDELKKEMEKKQKLNYSDFVERLKEYRAYSEDYLYKAINGILGEEDGKNDVKK